MKLKFSRGNQNSKLKKLEALTGKKLYTYSTLSGHNCPGASLCMAKVILSPTGGRRLIDGKDQQFRCFSAQAEAAYTGVYNQRKHNHDLIRKTKTKKDLVALIQKSLPKDAEIVRINVAGDIQSQKVFDAWLEIAQKNKNVIFYAYTKSIPFWVKRLGKIPDNLRLVASIGGRYDDLISKHKLRSAKVVFSHKEAKDLGLEIDYDDSHACLDKYKNQSFCLLLHGQQQANSEASKALQILKKEKV
jgi:hypothetical protein